MNRKEIRDRLTGFLASKKGQMILGQILSVLRGVEFVDRPKTIEEYNEKIAAQGFVLVSSLKIDITRSQFLVASLGWKRKSVETQEDIVDFLMQNFNEFSNGDKKSFCKVFQDTIKDNLLNPNIFALPYSLITGMGDVESLFHMLASKKPQESVIELFLELYLNLNNAITNWLVIYPLRSVMSASFDLGFDGISVYNPSDKDSWEKLTSKYKEAKEWHPAESQSEKPRFFGSVENPIYNFSKSPKTTWLICENTGTVDGSREDSFGKMRTFIAVVFSQIFSLPNLLDKSSERGNTYSKQFPSDDSRVGHGEFNASIGEVLPPMMCDLEVTEDVFSRIKAWYTKKDLLPVDMKVRVQVASQFIHYGIIADGIERFIHFFVVLDALFGERGMVETKISAGVKATFPRDALWEYKISRLFKLRSSIVHGGCSSISDWPEIDSYRRHTKSHPLADVITAAMTAFKNI